jgi:hypothetical protein
MALKSNFNESKSKREVQAQADTLYQKIINAFIYAAEDFIVNARGQAQSHVMGQYEDKTGNLRNSIGYFIFHNGELVHEKNEITANLSKVQDFIRPTGFQMILIAGMNYASYVESKGYNVISYQADVCMIDLAGYLENLEVIKQGTAARMEETFTP